MHPKGDPHVQTAPRNIARIAAPLAAKLAEIDPANAAYYQARYKALSERWASAMARWQREAAPLRGVPIVVQHKAFTYLIDWLGMNADAALEPKPRLHPTTAHLASLLETLPRTPA